MCSYVVGLIVAIVGFMSAPTYKLHAFALVLQKLLAYFSLIDICLVTTPLFLHDLSTLCVMSCLQSKTKTYSILLFLGVGLWGSDPLPNGSAFIANATGYIGIVYCHSASRQPLTAQWIGPSGSDITDISTDSFVITSHSGEFPSYSQLQLGAGLSFTSAEQGIYSCLLPDENGVQRTVNVGIYPYGYASEHLRPTNNFCAFVSVMCSKC